uniref:Uncharacterized protein n=1 Tax=Avena sativa TaxID=4498 RepID=A0ACD5TC79_AVESA
MTLAFDTVSETFRRMPLPLPAATVSEHFINLFDMRGTLAASVLGGEWPYMDVWALDDYTGARWSRRFRVELPTADTGTIGWKHGAAVAALEDDVLVLYTFGGGMTLYDVKEQRTVRVVRRGDDRVGSCRFVHVHRESLLPAGIDGLPCSSGGVVSILPWLAAIHYSSDGST